MEGDYDCDADYGHVDAEAEIGEECLTSLLAGVVRKGRRVRGRRNIAEVRSRRLASFIRAVIPRITVGIIEKERPKERSYTEYMRFMMSAKPMCQYIFKPAPHVGVQRYTK